MKTISLRVLGVGAVMLVVVIGAAITYWVMLSDARQALAEAKANAKQEAESELLALIGNKLGTLTLLAEEIVLLGQFNDANANYAETQLTKLWPKLQFTSSLNHLRLASAKGQEIIFGSEKTLVTSQIALQAARDLRPISQLDCERVCVLTTAVPIQIDGHNWALAVSEDIGDLLVEFSNFTHRDIGLLSSSDKIDMAETGRTIGPWSIPYITNGAKYASMWATFEQPLQHDSLSGGLLTSIDRSLLFVWQLTMPQPYGNDAEFLVVHDMSLWASDYQSRKNFVLTFVIALSAGMLVVIILLTLKPLRRMGDLVELVKLLGQQDYSGVENKLRSLPRGRFRDEIDIVDDALGEAVSKLKNYESQIQASKAKLHYLAMRDSVTNLYNRNAFISDLNQLKRSGERTDVAILFIDLDGFKPVNDNLGHEAGDQVLNILGRRLSQLSDEHVMVCRLGGDEFAVRVVNFDSREDVFQLVERLFAKFSAPIELREMSVNISASIGVAFSHSKSDMFDDLLRHADMAMYQAKRAGKNGFQVFDDSMETESSMQFRVKQDFAAALENSQLTMVFQPIVAIRSRQLTKLEALARWQHPELGSISPALFIPVLEESGQIAALTRWVIDQALMQLVKLDKLGLSSVRVAVNISGQQVTDASYVEQLYRRFQAAGIEPQRLELEITETSLIQDFQRAKAWVDEVSRRGFKVAIDDFGTGYSSLSYLTSISFDTVKLDRSLLTDVVHDETQQKVVASIGQMLHSLGVEVVAEGIETDNQLGMLDALHCDHAQGFLLAKPMGTVLLNEALEGYGKRGTWYNESGRLVQMASPLGIEPRSKP